MRASKGAIVIIASTRAFMSESNTEPYSASKGGPVALTHALAVSLAPDVRVNCVQSRLDCNQKLRQPTGEGPPQHPAGRVGTPHDIAEIVAWLLDGARSGFVTVRISS